MSTPPIEPGPSSRADYPPSSQSAIRTVAILGNHLPRHCGIATFTTALSGALAEQFTELDVFVLAMNDGGHRYAYPARVRFELAEGELGSYRRAADFLNVNDVDVVSVQHEYGIFGGKAGAYLLAVLRDLRMPIVSTLHTILRDPSPQQREVMQELLALSERVVVMSARARDLLREVHQVPGSKVDFIPHGTLVTPPARRSKYQLGVDGKSVILTFGLLSPDKGLEHMIEALPSIARRFPNVLYIVLGATHPQVKERHGEMYRLALETRAQRLGVDSHIIFHDRFVTQAELSEFLSATDIYVTPYLNAEQSTSGTLAYAMGAGKAVISTPYAYASEMLAEGRGVLVPARDPAALAEAMVDLLTDDAKRNAIGARAAAFGNGMAWPEIARQYQTTFARARLDHANRRRTVFQAKTLAKRTGELPETNLEHVWLMTDATGILQHAIFNIPRYDDGYCLDDNARALLLMALIEDAEIEHVRSTRALASHYLAFVNHAFNEASGRFRNFMSYSRRWTEDVGSEDSHGRALWALGTVVGRSRDPGRQSLSLALFQRGLRALGTFTSPRAWAFTLLGIDEYLRAFQGDSNVQALRLTLSERLLGLFQQTSADDWPWFEDSATYENARLPQALLVSGTRLRSEEMTAAAIRSLDWLVSMQNTDGYFAPFGSNGFYERGQVPAAFDQQPLDVYAMVSACLTARRATQDERWMVHARRTFGWFLGQNHLQRTIYDAATGGCRDGLHAERANENQGAESTLSFQLALLEMREVELAPAVRLVASHGNS
jgi:glycosyltransferase involved in cell wall biosynthesis